MSVPVLLLTIVVAMAVALVGEAVVTAGHVTPQPVLGTITLVSGNGDAIGFAPASGSASSPGVSYAVGRSVMVQSFADHAWWEGGWQGGRGPDCLQPSSSGARVELGIVQLNSASDAPGGPRLAWIKCLSAPTHAHTVGG